MRREEHRMQIGQPFLTALMYGDESGMNREDREHLKEFLAQFDGAIDVCLLPDGDEDYSEDSHFGRCAVCRLMSDVLNVIVIETIEEGA